MSSSCSLLPPERAADAEPKPVRLVCRHGKAAAREALLKSNQNLLAFHPPPCTARAPRAAARGTRHRGQARAASAVLRHRARATPASATPHHGRARQTGRRRLVEAGRHSCRLQPRRRRRAAVGHRRARDRPRRPNPPAPPRRPQHQPPRRLRSRQRPPLQRPQRARPPCRRCAACRRRLRATV